MASQESSRPVTLFYSYAHADEALREQLELHLQLLEHQGLLLAWHDRQIEAGSDWQHVISEHLEQASIILLLISPAFLASNYCYKVEMQRALERQQAGEARVIPLILHPCDWRATPLGQLQALPRDGKPIATWRNQDEAFLQVSRSLRALLNPQPPSVNGATDDAMQNRTNLLITLRRFYDEALDDGWQKLAWIDLPLTSMPGAVQTPANLLLHRVTLPAHPLTPGTTVQQVYQQANQELLILGEPGAGKSTLLYQFGRDLLAQAQQSAQPFPVVFSLSSWAQKRLPLHEWIVEQLCSSPYKVPLWQSQQWVHNQQILPMLDGLDEVEEAARPACIAAINAYRSVFPLCPLVVCSRSQEYYAASQDERLYLYSAIEVQPLTAGQQEKTLQQTGTTEEVLRDELASSAELRELARTPLWLNMLLVTAQETPLPTFPQEHSALQQEVLRRYVQRMCERKGRRKGKAARYSLAQTMHWLGFLAGQMRQRNQVVFSLEELQPDWLAKQALRAYYWSAGLLAALVGGLLVVLLGGLPGRLLVALSVGLSVVLENKVTLAERFAWSWKGARRVLGVVLGIVLGIVLVGGLSIALVGGLLSGLERKQVVERKTFSPGKKVSRSVKNGLLIGLVVGLLIGLVVGLLGVLIGVLVVGLAVGLVVGLVVGLLGGLASAFQHLMIRFWLARTDRFPWRALAFLNDACERALLKRVGGTYRFIHRLVLDYFADLEQPSARNTIDLPPSQTVELITQHQATDDTP